MLQGYGQGTGQVMSAGSGSVWQAGRRVLALAAALAVPLAAWAEGAVTTFAAPGADKPLNRALRDMSLTLQANADGGADAQELFAAARSDYGRLLGVLYAYGYYSGIISIRVDGREAGDIPPLDAPAQIGRVDISVSPGRPFRFATARMKPYAPGTKLPPAYRDGLVARSTAIADAARAGVEGWRALGYAKARVAGQEITADHDAGLVQAQVLLDNGPKLRFGPLTITGNQTISDRRIGQITGYSRGTTFDPEQIDKMQSRLRRTGVFRSVAIREADRPAADGTLPIALDLVEEAPRRFGFGAEVSSADGANLQAFWLHRNLWGGAERLRFDVEARGIDAQDIPGAYKLGARLERPATPFTDSSAFALASIEGEEILTQKIRTATLGIGLERVINDQLTAEIGVNYSITHIEDQAYRSDFRVLALPLSLEWDRRDDVLSPRSGSYVKAGVTPFFGFGTTGSGTHFTADARAYRSFGAEDRVTLAGRLQAGTVSGAGLLATPPDYLFYSGGAGTVRGHPFQSLGVPVLRGGGATETGGQSFIGLSGEIRAMIGNRVGAAAFYDAGYISPGAWFGGGGGEWHSGAGIGLRYDTGFGPVRLDLALPVSGRTGDGLQVYVGIGQAF